MKRFSAREFALLCLPVAAVAGAGFWASWRDVKERPWLNYRVQTPTVMQTFDGVKVVLVVDVMGEDYKIQRSRTRLDFVTMEGTTFWENDTRGSVKTNSFRNARINARADSLKMSEIPSGEVFLDYKAWITPNDVSATSKPVLLEGRWKLDKSRIQKFDSKQSKVPLVSLKSVIVSSIQPNKVAGSGSKIRCDVLFVNEGELSDSSNGMQSRFNEANGWMDAFSLRDETPNSPSYNAMFSLNTYMHPWQKSKPNASPQELLCPCPFGARALAR